MRAYIGLGSNLDDPYRQVLRAFAGLAGMRGSALLRCSPLYRTAPMGPADQPDYVNAVAEVATVLSPRELLEALQAIESAQDRRRSAERWGPRTLDLDLLVFGDLRLQEPGLVLPHPGLAQRGFVLWPWSDLAPELEVPGLGAVEALLAALGETRPPLASATD